MPYSDNGAYSLPNGYKAFAGTPILDAQHNLPLEDIQSALSQALLRDGRAPLAGNLNLNGFRAIGAGAGVGATDLVTKGQLDDAVMTSPKSFGAAGNGVTMDTDALQAALNALGAAGGGTLWLGDRRNRYRTCRLTIPANVRIAGARASIEPAMWTFVGNGSQVTFPTPGVSAANIGAAVNTTPAAIASIIPGSSVTLASAPGAGTTVRIFATSAIDYTGANVTIEGVRIIGGVPANVYVPGHLAITAIGAAYNAYNNVVRADILNAKILFCEIDGFGETAVRWDGVIDGLFFGNTITNCGVHGLLGLSCVRPLVIGNTIDGIWPGAGPFQGYGISFSRAYSILGGLNLIQAPPSRDVVILGNTIRNVLNYTAIDFHGVWHGVIEGNRISRFNVGVNLEHADMPIITENLTTTSGSTAATWDGVGVINPGMAIDGPNVAPGTTILAVAGVSITLSANATATGTTAHEFRQTGWVAVPFICPRVRNNTIDGSDTPTANRGPGIWVDGSVAQTNIAPIIEGNLVKQCGQGGTTVTPTPAAIMLTRTAGAAVCNNTVMECHGVGININDQNVGCSVKTNKVIDLIANGTTHSAFESRFGSNQVTFDDNDFVCGSGGANCVMFNVGQPPAAVGGVLANSNEAEGYRTRITLDNRVTQTGNGAVVKYGTGAILWASGPSRREEHIVFEHSGATPRIVQSSHYGSSHVVGLPEESRFTVSPVSTGVVTVTIPQGYFQMGTTSYPMVQAHIVNFTGANAQYRTRVRSMAATAGWLTSFVVEIRDSADAVIDLPNGVRCAIKIEGR